MRKLTKEESELWRRVTKTIRPLDSSPVSPVETLSRVQQPQPLNSSFRPVLDLHGAFLHDAYVRAKSHVEDAYLKGFKYVIVITGLSGQIHDEFPRWFADHPHVRSINSLRGGGAWEVWLKKRDT